MVESTSGNGDPFARFLHLQGAVVLDGGLATELEARGFDLDDDLWSARLLIERPEAIRRLHHDYLLAGADCVISASYQATISGFGRRGIEPGAAEGLLQLAVKLALEARDDFWSRPENRRGRLEPRVAASVGPYGAYLADGSEYTGGYRGAGENQLMDFHRRRLEILSASGADLLACETIPSAIEARALARLLDQVPGPPAWLSFCCRDDRRLGDGSELATIVEALDGHQRIAAFGVNCVAPRYVHGLIARLSGATSKPIAVYPNSGEAWDAAGKRWVKGEGAQGNAAGAASVAWHRAGARLIGGCCRTGPRDVGRIRASLLSIRAASPA